MSRKSVSFSREFSFKTPVSDANESTGSICFSCVYGLSVATAWIHLHVNKCLSLFIYPRVVKSFLSFYDILWIKKGLTEFIISPFHGCGGWQCVAIYTKKPEPSSREDGPGFCWTLPVCWRQAPYNIAVWKIILSNQLNVSGTSWAQRLWACRSAAVPGRWADEQSCCPLRSRQ